MTTILIRTFIIYIILICVVRLMGKRQIGELEVSDLVGTLILSEIASMPIENPEIPVSHAIIPLISILTIEVVMSVVLMKFPKLKSFISTRPSTLIDKGTIDQREMNRARMSVEELIGSLRQKDVADIGEVEYAILEQSGKMTVVKKARYKQPTLLDMSIKAKESGIMHILVSNGYVNKYNLDKHKKSPEWLRRSIADHGCEIDEVFLFMIDDAGDIVCIKKDKKE